MNDDLVPIDFDHEGRFQKGEILENEPRQHFEPRDPLQRRGVDEFQKISNF